MHPIHHINRCGLGTRLRSTEHDFIDIQPLSTLVVVRVEHLASGVYQTELRRSPLILSRARIESVESATSDYEIPKTITEYHSTDEVKNIYFPPRIHCAP